VDIGEIDAGLRACIETWFSGGQTQGAVVFQRQERLRNSVRAAKRDKARWVELVEHADLPEEEKWLIFTMLICGDARIEEVPGLGLKVTLPPSPRH
jgi:hypothetical protein